MGIEQTENVSRVEQILASGLKDARELSGAPSQELEEHKDMLAELVSELLALSGYRMASELRALSCNG